MKKLLSIYFLFFTLIFFAQEDFGTGLKFSEEKYNEITMSVPLVTRSFNSLPSSYSLKPYAPTPKSQGSQGSCTAWATAYGARTISYAIKNGWKNNIQKINANAFSPAFVYNKIKKKYTDCSDGTFISDAMRLLKESGVSKITDFPYQVSDCSKLPSENIKQKATNYKIESFERLTTYPYANNIIEKVKKAIANKNPVIIGMFDYGTIYGYGELYVKPTTPKKGGGHAMLVVGYDDNKYGGTFEIMNSYGTKFRNNGFFRIKYDDFKTFVKSAYVLIDKTPVINNNNNNNNNNYTSNKLGGEMVLKLSSGSNMPVSLASGATRNFNIVKATKTTYKVNKSYTSGTQFRIHLKSKQRGYVYLIGYGSADKSVNKLYPFGGYSDFFNYTNSEIALPNEDYFIEFDNKPGRDILCVLYSKEKLNISDIVNKAKYGSGDFVSRIKKALSYKMFKGNDVTFSKSKIAFNATSNSLSAKVVPIFIEMNHQ